MDIERANGVHSNERSQADRSKTPAEQYAEFHKLDFSKCANPQIIDGHNKKVTRLN